MALTLDKRVEIELLSGRQGWTQRQVADEFNARYSERNPITHSAVGKLVKKLKETGSVVDKPRVGRPSVGKDIQTGVIAKFHAHSHWFQTFRTFCRIRYTRKLYKHLEEKFPGRSWRTTKEI
jgi:transposase